MSKLLSKNQKGFTLIEVMLVVLIIGIIAIIALPKLLVTRETASEKSCLSNLQALRTANEQYKWDNPAGTYAAGADVPALIVTLTAGLDTDGDPLTPNVTYLPTNSTVSGVCPSPELVDGTANYAYDEDTGAITCAVHATP